MTAIISEAQAAAPAYFSANSAAAYLDVHPALIYKEIRAGRLRAVRIGTRVVRISREALEAYIEAQSTVTEGQN